MNAVRDEETDSLSGLEEQILRAVEVVSVLRQEKDALARKLEEAEAERLAALKELESLRSERRQVRTRIEKLKDQLELLGGN